MGMRESAQQSNALQSELKNPILDIAASFWDDELYRAFRVCYQSMRQLDDIVDNLKISGLSKNPELRAEVKEELEEVIFQLQNDVPAPAEVEELRETMKRFYIPMQPWLRLARSMEFDLEHSGFDSFLQFVRYAKGAAVAPASIFIHLIGLSHSAGNYTPAPVDIFQSARPLAMFSYLTHILRDFRKDAEEGLEYFPESTRRFFSITTNDWKSSADGSQTVNFTAMVKRYHQFSSKYRSQSIVENNPITPFLGEANRFSLHLIWDLYSQIHESIVEADYILDPQLIHPTKSEIYNRVMNLADKMKVDHEILNRGLRRVGFVE